MFPELFLSRDVCGWVVFVSRTLAGQASSRVLEIETTHPHTSMVAKSFAMKNHPPTYIYGGKESWDGKPPTHIHTSLWRVKDLPPPTLEVGAHTPLNAQDEP